MNNELQLVDNFKDSVFNNDVNSLIKDISEITIDSILNDGLLKDIPIVSSIASAIKIGANVHDRNMLKQTLVFINEFNNQTINQHKCNEYREKVSTNSKKADKELGRVIILLNQNIDIIKSKLLAILFVEYINLTIDWSKFVVLSDIINQMIIYDFNVLLDLFHQNSKGHRTQNRGNILRLISLGLVFEDERQAQTGEIKMKPFGLNSSDMQESLMKTSGLITRFYNLTEDGKQLSQVYSKAITG